MNNYDVIIVGAGLGGLKLAENFNGSSLRVLLLERGTNINKLSKTYFGTFLEYIERWNLQKYMIHQCGWGMYSKEVKYFNKLEGRSLCVLDMAPWAKKIKLNCAVLTGVEIVDFTRLNGLAEVTDSAGVKYSAKVIVDCTGIAQTISSILGIKKSGCDFLNYVYVMKGVKLDNPDEMFYFEDMNLTNCGGWFHALGRDTCLVGCAEFTGPMTLGSVELKKRLDEYVKNFAPLNTLLKGGKVVEEFCMAGPTTTMHSSIVEDNYLAVGDAAGAGGPFIGDGFRMAFGMADAAFETIIKSFERNDFSRKAMVAYHNSFWQEFGRWYKWSTLLRFVWVRYLTNTELHLMAARLNKMSDDDFYNIITSKITPKILLKLFNGRVVFHLVKNICIVHILEPLGIYKLPRRPLVFNK